MPRSRKLTSGKTAEICACLILGESQGSLAKRMEVAQQSISKLAAILRNFGIPLTKRTWSPIDQGKADRIIELIESTSLSNREIARQLSCGLETVSRRRRKFEAAILAKGGTLPLCGCGQRLHHPRRCSERNRQYGKQFRHREEARARIIAGERIKDVAKIYAVCKGTIQRICQDLSPLERETRANNRSLPASRSRAKRAAERVTAPLAIDPRHDPLYARIAAAAPRGVDPAIKEDAVSAVYLACLEGKVKASAIGAAVRRAINKDGRGMFSLNSNLRADSDATFLDQLQDPSALEAFDEIGFPV